MFVRKWRSVTVRKEFCIPTDIMEQLEESFDSDFYDIF